MPALLRNWSLRLPRDLSLLAVLSLAVGCNQQRDLAPGQIWSYDNRPMASTRTSEKAAAWILLAMDRAGYRNSAPSVRDIVAEADAINHAIISYEELEEGLALLRALGYAHREPGNFVLPEAASKLLEKLRGENQNEAHLETWPKLEARLASQDTKISNAQTSTPNVNHDEYQSAVREYAVYIPFPRLISDSRISAAHKELSEIVRRNPRGINFQSEDGKRAAELMKQIRDISKEL